MQFETGAAASVPLEWLIERASDPKAARRLLAKVRIDPETGCWLFQGAIDPSGYSRFRFGFTPSGASKMDYGHRAAVILWHGPIPPGLTVDHLCREWSERRCCCPWHLDVCSTGENCLRSPNTLTAQARAITHCRPGGHEFTPETTYVDTKGHRNCRICRREQDRLKRALARNSG